MLTINIGPMALPSGQLLLIMSLVLATAVGWWAGRRQQRNPERQLFYLLIAGLLVARVAFVIGYFQYFQDNLWGMLDIRDGGFIIWPGVIAIMLGGAWLAWRDTTLRRSLGIALTAGLAFWSIGMYSMNAYQKGTHMPELALQDINGNPVSLSDYKGRPVVVNLWATWCPPCRREMPVLAAAQQDESDITFLFINQGEGDSEIEKFLLTDNLQISNVLLDSGARLGQQLGSKALPTTLFYNAEGRQVASHLGELSSASLMRQIGKLKEEIHP